MDRVNKLYNNLQNNIPFCFIKMNDGEISAMLNSDASLSRGDETSSNEMSEKLKNCLTYINPEYYIGLPCFMCYNYYFNESIQYIYNNIDDNNIDDNTEENTNFVNNNILNANILINTNIDKTLDVFFDTIKNKNIIFLNNEKK